MMTSEQIKEMFKVKMPANMKKITIPEDSPLRKMMQKKNINNGKKMTDLVAALKAKNIKSKEE